MPKEKQIPCDTIYLGARFVRFLLQTDDLDSLISYGISEVKAGFSDFIHA